MYGEYGEGLRAPIPNTINTLRDKTGLSCLRSTTSSVIEPLSKRGRLSRVSLHESFDFDCLAYADDIYIFVIQGCV